MTSLTTLLAIMKHMSRSKSAAAKDIDIDIDIADILSQKYRYRHVVSVTISATAMSTHLLQIIFSANIIPTSSLITNKIASRI